MSRAVLTLSRLEASVVRKLLGNLSFRRLVLSFCARAGVGLLWPDLSSPIAQALGVVRAKGLLGFDLPALLVVLLSAVSSVVYEFSRIKGLNSGARYLAILIDVTLVVVMLNIDPLWIPLVWIAGMQGMVKKGQQGILMLWQRKWRSDE